MQIVLVSSPGTGQAPHWSTALAGEFAREVAAKGATVALPQWCYVAGGLGVLALVGMTVATGRRVSRQLDAYEKRV